MSKLQDTIQEWKDLEPKKKAFLGVVALAGIIFIVVHAIVNDKKPDSVAAAASSEPSSSTTLPASQDSTKNHLTILPKNSRNQGLEDLATRLDQLEGLIKSRLGKSDTKEFMPPGQINSSPEVKSPPPINTSSTGTTSTSATVNLDKPLEPPARVDFNEPSSVPAKRTTPAPTLDANDNIGNIPAPRPQPAEMKIWDSQSSNIKEKEIVEPTILIPVNSGLDAVMLTGVNARQPGSSTGAASSATSALNVGAPFVTRLKGDAILPNGWKISRLGDCFLGGSAVAILSTERANAIADTISCVKPNGEVWEAPVKAYAIDVDGTMGIAGKVVSKQGSLLMQSALAGVASGLGSALAPAPLASFNNSAQSGQDQGYQNPNTKLIVGSALGQGISNASAQLSKFYLEYAREIFPVVEVTNGTRITWILKESIELKRTKSQQVSKK
jgi:conjugal transfer pilus assembly protein TraB